MQPQPTILCVDDYLGLLKTLALALEGLGFRVLTASTLEEASALSGHGPDIVLLEYNLCPGCPTAELCAAEQFRAVNPKIKVVVWSADDRALRLTPPCAAAALMKPVDPVELARSLRRIVDHDCLAGEEDDLRPGCCVD